MLAAWPAGLQRARPSSSRTGAQAHRWSDDGIFKLEAGVLSGLRRAALTRNSRAPSTGRALKQDQTTPKATLPASRRVRNYSRRRGKNGGNIAFPKNILLDRVLLQAAARYAAQGTGCATCVRCGSASERRWVDASAHPLRWRGDFNPTAKSTATATSASSRAVSGKLLRLRL